MDEDRFEKKLSDIWDKIGENSAILNTLYNPEVKNGLIPRLRMDFDNHLKHHSRLEIGLALGIGGMIATQILMKVFGG